MVVKQVSTMTHKAVLLYLFFMGLLYKASYGSTSRDNKDRVFLGFLEILERQHWEIDDKPCIDATIDMLNGVKNSTLWATWIWDSMQQPFGVLYGSRYQFGNFDQCLRPPWFHSHPHLRTQYCLVDIPLTKGTPKKYSRSADPNDPTELYVNTASKFGRHFNVMTWGTCFSKRCSEKTIIKLVKIMLQKQHLQSKRDISKIIVHSCQGTESLDEYSFSFYMFMCVVSILFFIVILSTWYISLVQSDTFSTKLAKSFCLKKNWDSLIKINKDDIEILSSMRIFNSLTVALMHCVVFSISRSVINGLDVMESEFSPKPLSKLLHVDTVVDTFLVMSGLLLVRSIVRHQELRKGSLFKILWTRYMRLVGPQAFMAFFYMYALKYVGSGPLWPLMGKLEIDDCVNNWWANVLMVSNYVDPSHMCNLVAWYNSCDYQLIVFGLVLYYLYQSKRCGKKLLSIIFVILLAWPGILTYLYKYPVNLIFDAENLLDIKRSPGFLGVYIQAHNRASSFLIGMILGHITTIYQPKDHRNVIPKKWALLGTLSALFVMERVASVGASITVNGHTPLEGSIYVAINRSIWSLAICALIIFAEYSTVPVIGDVWKLKVAVPLGRLAYGVYMVHMVFVYHMVYSIRAPITYDFVTITITSFGVILISYLTSIMMWHFVEAPTMNLSNLLLDVVTRNKSKEIGGNKIEMAEAKGVLDCAKNE